MRKRIIDSKQPGIYKKSTRFKTFYNYDTSELDNIINIIKQTGLIPSGYYVSPIQIEPYLKKLYDTIQCELFLNDASNSIYIDQLKLEFINLSQPIQLPIIKKFIIKNRYSEFRTIAIIKLMEIINKNTYDPKKSSITSQIYENVQWVILKFFKDEKDYEKTILPIINL